MRRGRVIPILVLLLLSLAVGSLWLYRSLYGESFDDPPVSVAVHVPAGTSLRACARLLVEAELLAAEWQLLLVARWEGADRNIKAGRYEFVRGSSAADILRKLVAGEVSTIAVTIPEGWTLRSIASAFSDSLGFKVRRIGGLKSTLFSGEGLVVDLTGPGRVLMQTRSTDAFLSWLIPNLPKPERGSSGHR